jgi:hypothetical protein
MEKGKNALADAAQEPHGIIADSTEFKADQAGRKTGLIAFMLERCLRNSTQSLQAAPKAGQRSGE